LHQDGEKPGTLQFEVLLAQTAPKAKKGRADYHRSNRDEYPGI
jgi:hypothetical protein